MYSFWDVNVAMLEGSVTTLQMFVLTLLFALPLGLIISFGSMSRFSPLRWLTKTFVWIIRGSPLMLQILIVFYGPGLLFGWKALPRFTAALVTFVINYACYFSEIYRGGIQGVPKGQQEAGQVLGMTCLLYTSARPVQALAQRSHGTVLSRAGEPVGAHKAPFLALSGCRTLDLPGPPHRSAPLAAGPSADVRTAARLSLIHI